MSQAKPTLLARIFLKLIAVYQYFISPMLGPHCRYTPTCSAYARQAVCQHGALKGSWLSLRRVCRCHPLHAGGYDPVPDSPELIKK